jgi:hypothetical protein
MAELVWMGHPDIEKKAQFAPDAVEIWKARGWSPCDPPPEEDPTKTVPAEATPQTEPPEENPAASSSPKSARGRTSKEGSD